MVEVTSSTYNIYKSNKRVTNMAKVKYRVREYKPNANMPGTHGFYAEVVISTDIDATELAKI